MIGVDDRLVTPTTMKWVKVGLIAGLASRIVYAMCEAALQVGAALFERRPDDLGIEIGIVGRSHRVEQLAREEVDGLLVARRHAPDTCGRVMPPLLIEKERLADQTVGRRVPGLVPEPAVLNKRFDAWLRRLPEHALGSVLVVAC